MIMIYITGYGHVYQNTTRRYLWLDAKINDNFW